MSIETEMQKIQQRRSELMLRKNDIQRKLLNIKHLLETDPSITADTYRICRTLRRDHAIENLEIERQLTDLKKRQGELMTLNRQAETKTKPDTGDVEHGGMDQIRELITGLVALRQDYQNFAADLTRISSMRQMAAEFVVKLNPLIKQGLATNTQHQKTK